MDGEEAVDKVSLYRRGLFFIEKQKYGREAGIRKCIVELLEYREQAKNGRGGGSDTAS